MTPRIVGIVRIETIDVNSTSNHILIEATSSIVSGLHHVSQGNNRTLQTKCATDEDWMRGNLAIDRDWQIELVGNIKLIMEHSRAQ